MKRKICDDLMRQQASRYESILAEKSKAVISLNQSLTKWRNMAVKMARHIHRADGLLPLPSLTWGLESKEILEEFFKLDPGRYDLILNGAVPVQVKSKSKKPKA